MAGGNEIHGLSSNSVAQRNMQPSVQKSLFQKIIACFTQPNIICMPPEVKVIQEGGEILSISVNKGSERQSSMEVTIPSNCTLKQFTSTQDIEPGTENRENTENTENRILNHSSDLKLENQSCLTKKGRRKNPENTNFSIKSDIQSAKKSCSSSIEYPEENKTLYHRGFPVGFSTKKCHFNGNTCLLESVKFRKENRSRSSKTSLLFRLKGIMYSSAALVHLNMESFEITNLIDIICISETESDVRVEVLTGLSRYMALQFAKLILNNGQRVRKLKELIQCIELGNQTVDDLDFLERVKTDDEGYLKSCYSLNQDLYGKQSRTTKINDIEDKTAVKMNEMKVLLQDISKIPQDKKFKMDATKYKIVAENSFTKCSTDSKWNDHKKMGHSKVRTQSDRPTWNICLLNREDEAGGLMTEYFWDSMFPGKYHETRDKVIGKETKKRENEDATDSTPVIFAKPGNPEVWNFMNERTKLPNTCKVKQTGRHRLDQEVNWDELVQGITVPDINRTEDNQENGCFGGHSDRIKTVVIKQEHDWDKTVNTTKKETKKLCKLCQERELDTIFLPCGHLVLCNFCCASQTIKICPQCFNEIKHVNEAHF